jgi:hypothetical protein
LLDIENMKIFIFFMLLFFRQLAFSQSVIDTIAQEQPHNFTDLITEEIVRVSPSQKIFILTNENKAAAAGDYVTIVLDERLVARAIVAKNTQDRLGIKILKIYLMEEWRRLHLKQKVKLIKGDDSAFLNPPKEKEPTDLAETVPNKKGKKKDDVLSESELVSSFETEDVDERSKRIIKTDNIVTLAYAQLNMQLKTENKGISHFMGMWAYQVMDNFWAEGSYGWGTISSYPSTDTDTTITSISARAKYTMDGPFYSYLSPFIGYEIIKASGSAGSDPSGTLTQDQLDDEKNKLSDLETNSVVCGITLLKRLVPGWFVRFDTGLRNFKTLDLLSIGFSFEF